MSNKDYSRRDLQAVFYSCSGAQITYPDDMPVALYADNILFRIRDWDSLFGDQLWGSHCIQLYLVVHVLSRGMGVVWVGDGDRVGAL